MEEDRICGGEVLCLVGQGDSESGVGQQTESETPERKIAMPKCSNPNCSQDAGIEGFCSSACRVASRGGPKAVRVPAQPKPPAVTDAVCSVATAAPLTKATAPLAQVTVIPRGEPREDLDTRLQRMKSYRQWALENELPSQHILSESELKAMLARSGYDPKLSAKVFP